MGGPSCVTLLLSALALGGLTATSALQLPATAPRIARIRSAGAPLLLLQTEGGGGGGEGGAIEGVALRLWAEQAIAMWGAAAVLGPLCDGCHSRHDVLHYADPSRLSVGSLYSLETCWWVPLLFGGAGVLLGSSHPWFDRRAERLGEAPRRPAPGWPSVLLSIACFVLCYELSGILGEAAASRPPVDLVDRISRVDGPLLVNALAIFLIFERTPGGLFMALLCAAVGPVVEIGLINVGHLYAYTHPDVAGIPLWIPQVYFAGAPAVGALGRQVLFELESKPP